MRMIKTLVFEKEGDAEFRIIVDSDNPKNIALEIEGNTNSWFFSKHQAMELSRLLSDWSKTAAEPETKKKRKK